MEMNVLGHNFLWGHFSGENCFGTILWKIFGENVWGPISLGKIGAIFLGGIFVGKIFFGNNSREKYVPARSAGFFFGEHFSGEKIFFGKDFFDPGIFLCGENFFRIFFRIFFRNFFRNFFIASYENFL